MSSLIGVTDEEIMDEVYARDLEHRFWSEQDAEETHEHKLKQLEERHLDEVWFLYRSFLEDPPPVFDRLLKEFFGDKLGVNTQTY